MRGRRSEARRLVISRLQYACRADRVRPDRAIRHRHRHRGGRGFVILVGCRLVVSLCDSGEHVGLRSPTAKAVVLGDVYHCIAVTPTPIHGGEAPAVKALAATTSEPTTEIDLLMRSGFRLQL